MIEFTTLPLAALQPNKGQIEGLPANPRQWTKEDIDKIAKSLRETPELFEARPIIVVKHGEKYVILGGNLRYEGSCRNLDPLDKVPVAILPTDTSIDKMKEIIVKDNVAIGAWDYDALANLWDDLPLLEWGVPVWDTDAGEETNPDQFGEDFSLPDGDGPVKNQITFYFAPEQKEFIEDALSRVTEVLETFGNENATGNKLYTIVAQWDAQRK